MQALVVVDMQKAFVSGAEATPMKDVVLPAVAELLDRARAAGCLIVHLQNDGPAGAADEPHQRGWELYFPVAAGETVIRKTEDDGFQGTPLDDLLAQAAVTRVAVCGVMSEMCVLATARAALDRGFGVVLPHDAHATFDIGPAPGSTQGVPAAQAARVPECALGDQVEIVARAGDVDFETGARGHWSARLPTKRVAADCLVRDASGRILLVRPTYKPTWDLPGGVVERDESPGTAARRELAEEVGLEVRPGDLLCADWIGPSGGVTEVLALLFDGGVVSDGTSVSIDPEQAEIAEARFVTPSEAAMLLDDEAALRMNTALANLSTGRCTYLEAGSPVRRGPR